MSTRIVSRWRYWEPAGRGGAIRPDPADSDAYAERLKMLRAFRGIDYLTALTLICEIGDFRRFPTAEAFVAYLGVVPSEHSSGKKRQQGGVASGFFRPPHASNHAWNKVKLEGRVHTPSFLHFIF